MKAMRIIIILMASAVFMYSCTYSNIYINRETDNNDGKVFLNNIYQEIANKNFDGIDAVVSDSLKNLAGANGISKLAAFINRKVGNYKSYEIADYYIRCVTGSTNQISYNYKLKVTYEKGIVDEIVGLRKENGSSIKLNSYHANSDLLIK